MKTPPPTHFHRIWIILLLVSVLIYLGQLSKPNETSAHAQYQTTLIDGTDQPESTLTPLPTVSDPQVTLTTPIIVTATQTIAAGDVVTATSTLQPAPSLTPTYTITPTIGAVSAITVTLDPTTTTSLVYLPFAIHRPVPTFIPASKVIFCNSSSASIPDNIASGVDRTITITDPRSIVDLDVTLDINHAWVGDLKLKLSRQEIDRTLSLIDRPGYPESDYGCSYDNIRAILDDEMSSPVANKCASSPAAISGIYTPESSLDAFDGQPVNGNWILNISDRSPNDTGRINQWCLVASLSPAPEPPTPTPIPPTLPSQAIINNVTGRGQALPLDCESRSAVDWANYFGRRINEIEFFNNTPASDNPDTGFVGDVYGQWGQIPPNDYGVHAEPVAALLRQYGLQAYAHRPLSWDGLRTEIAAGRPVIVWIIGSITNGMPVYYTPSDGLSTVVARYEHTVVVTGYTQNLVYYLNGDTIYTRSISQFLDSWSALGNMAVTARP